MEPTTPEQGDNGVYAKSRCAFISTVTWFVQDTIGELCVPEFLPQTLCAPEGIPSRSIYSNITVPNMHPGSRYQNQAC